MSRRRRRRRRLKVEEAVVVEDLSAVDSLEVPEEPMASHVVGVDAFRVECVMLLAQVVQFLSSVRIFRERHGDLGVLGGEEELGRWAEVHALRLHRVFLAMLVRLDV